MPHRPCMGGSELKLELMPVLAVGWNTRQENRQSVGVTNTGAAEQPATSYRMLASK